MSAESAHAASEGRITDVRFNPYDVSSEQKAARTVRFPKLDQNSVMNFVVGFRKWNSAERYGTGATAQASDYLRSKGLATGESNASYEESFRTMLGSPSFAMNVRLFRSLQGLMWNHALRAFHEDAAKYIALMEATDSAGPGSLELNPDLDLPGYTRHEIHGQPGGYVGDPFAGWVYHWALARGFYYQFRHEENFMAVAQNCMKPADGQVRRILDLGCGSGLTTTALKTRFPDAEVWGIDAGGPMVRYAHHRAARLGVHVHFAQRLIEDNRFPDEHFDIVSSYILFHEVSHDAAVKAVREIARVLRPGGIYNHVDTLSEGMVEQGPTSYPVREESATIVSKANAWQNHRHNIEPWALEYRNSNFPGMLREAGFDVTVAPETPYGSPLPQLSAVKRR
jgi:ubiquinone/menaquinone biosynthesis C-methylase UbiE